MRKTIAVLVIIAISLLQPVILTSDAAKANTTSQSATPFSSSSGFMGYAQALYSQTRKLLCPKQSDLDGLKLDGEKREFAVADADVSSALTSTHSSDTFLADQGQDEVAYAQKNSQNSISHSPGDPDQEGSVIGIHVEEMDAKFRFDVSSHQDPKHVDMIKIASDSAATFAGSPPVIEMQGFHVAIEEIEMQTEMQNYTLKMQKEDLIHYA